MKKGFTLLVMLVVAVALFANATSEKVAKPAVSHVSFWLDDMTDARMDMVSKIIEKFEATHPSIKIDLQVFQVMALTS